MKKILEKSRFCLALLSTLLLIYGCGSATGPMATFDPDDESGIGGTGMLAQENGPDTIAIIGAITGFGSIFINGVEIAIPGKTMVYENGDVVPQPRFAIGDVLEVLAVPGKNMHEARRIHRRHEVSGPVTKVNQEARSFEIMKQVIIMASLQGQMPNIGERLQVSGFRDNDQRIHASRLTKTHSATVSLSGKVTGLHGNTLLIGTMVVMADQLPDLEIGSHISVQGTLHDGKLLARTVRPISVLPFADQADRWLVQGYVNKQGADQFSMAGIAVTAGSANLHKLLGRQTDHLIRVEIAGKPTAASGPIIMSILDTPNLPMGRRTPQPEIPTRPLMRKDTSRPQGLPSPMNRHPAGIMRR